MMESEYVLGLRNMIQSQQMIRMPRKEFHSYLKKYLSGQDCEEFKISFGSVQPTYEVSVAEVFYHAGIFDKLTDVIRSGEDNGFVFIVLKYKEV